MSKQVHKRIKRLLEETNDAYTLDGYLNADYPEFAGLSISEFKAILKSPDLTRRQLVRMLRKGSTKHRDISPKSCWATFLANYVNNVSNTDGAKHAPLSAGHAEHK